MKKSVLNVLFLTAMFGIIVAICSFIANYNRFVLTGPLEDIDYKTALVKHSGNIFYKLENLRPLVGEEELTEFIKANDKNPQIYIPSEENINKGIFRANLHMHSTKSDGELTVKEIMDSAQEYAENNIKDGYMYIGITDHNTVLGAKEIISVLQQNPGKYDRIKVIPGIEIYTTYNEEKYKENPVEVHVLTWCIDPYNKSLESLFHKKNPNDKWNRRNVDWPFSTIIRDMTFRGLVGIAHPAIYTAELKQKKYNFIKDMYDTFAKYDSKPLVVEGYYRSYVAKGTDKEHGKDFQKFLDYINSEASKRGILRTGSTDAHGRSIFSYR